MLIIKKHNVYGFATRTINSKNPKATPAHFEATLDFSRSEFTCYFLHVIMDK